MFSLAALVVARYNFSSSAAASRTALISRDKALASCVAIDTSDIAD